MIHLLKNKEEAYEKIIEMSKNSDYTTGNILDCDYFSKNCQLIAVNLNWIGLGNWIRKPRFKNKD